MSADMNAERETLEDSAGIDMDGAEDDGMNEIGQLLNDYTSLQAAHRSLVERCDTQAAEIYAEVQEEMDTLKTKVTHLEAELAKASTEKEELNATVRDLRVRVEESRRAIMRLQGTTGGSATASSPAIPVANGASGSSNNRRSMGPGALASWNPREVNVANHGAESTDDSADLKKSKRASLAFGPNAQSSNARRAQGHSRTTSGNHLGQSEDGSAPTNTQGLRELTLGGPSVQSPSVQSTSKRNSFIGSLLMPSSDAGDANQDASTGSLLMPAKPNRRSSNGSTFSNNGREDGDGNLAVPSSSRSNPSPVSSTKQLPISEADEDAMIDLDLNDAPLTARPGDVQSASVGSTFSGIHQAESGHLRRLLAEQKSQVQERDHQLAALQREMRNLRLELDDAKEARLASEACLKALREFVKSEGGSSADSDGGVKLLKGVKLPPLPTDKDDDEDEITNDTPFTPPLPSKGKFGDATTPTLSSSAWKSIGSTLAGLSRTKSGQDEEPPGNTSTSSALSDSGPSTIAPMSPAASLGNSIGSFWSRSTAPKNRDSISTASTTPSEAPTIASKDTLTSNTTGDTAPSTTVNTPVSATGFKGFTWFNKRTVSDETPDEEVAPVVNTRVASPPFANLDHNVITLDTSAPPLPDRKNTRTSSFAAPDSPTKMEPNGRTRKAKETSDVVDEDSGFVPPAFQQ